MTSRVVVLDPPADAAWGRALAAHMTGVEFLVPSLATDADELVRSADVVVATGRRRVDSDLIATFDRAVAVLCLSVGTDQVDADAAASASLEILNVPDYCTSDVADHAMALLLALQRRLVPIVQATRAGAGIEHHVAPLRRMSTQTLGIIGAGRIGRLVASRARAFGFETIAYDPGLSSVDTDLELVDLTTLARRADAVVVCAALTPASRHTLDSAFFAWVRRGLVVVNVARGGLIDEVALAAALDDGVVACAALDVREHHLGPDPLAGRDDVIVTPHLAGTSIEAVADLMSQAAARTHDALARAGRVSAGNDHEKRTVAL